MSEVKCVITGASGRMGQALIKLIGETQGVTLHAALEAPTSPHLGKDSGENAGLKPNHIPITDNALEAIATADSIIDFTAPAASVLYAGYAAQARIPHIIGSTGFTPEQDEQIKAAARNAPIVKSGNMSLGITLLAELVRQAAQALGPEYDIEILEMHHRHKVDAPSGTALLLGEAAAQGRNLSLKNHSIRTRDGHTGPRPHGDIGFATLRGGSVVGDHQVILAGPSERIELAHKAEDRTIFAQGALKAMFWSRNKPPALYTMRNVLDLEK